MQAGVDVLAKGWVRTKRGNKEIAFIALNDGSTIRNIQIVADKNETTEPILAKISTGACIGVEGKLVESVGSGQSVEIKAENITVYGECDPMKYPLQKKDIKEGDVVRLFNDRGNALCVAHITRRVNPETIHVYTSSGIYNPVQYGEVNAVEKGGSINVLTPGRLMGDYIPAMVPNSCNIDVEKAEADPNPGQGWEGILAAVDKQQLDTQRPMNTSFEADIVFGEKEAK